MTKCGYKWRAPYLLAPGSSRELKFGGVTVLTPGDKVLVDQVCILERGHEGPHRSSSNAIKGQ